jgi:hypothetical protein
MLLARMGAQARLLAERYDLPAPCVAVRARFPYELGLKSEDGGAFIMGGRRSDHLLTEISGRGCEALYTAQTDMIILEDVITRLTRIDLAVDIQTKTDPAKFCKIRSGRMRTFSLSRSDTGTTVYVGSRKSKRYCRVYRYSEPHPRHDLLRVEFVARKEQSRVLGAVIIDEGYIRAAARLGATYGFDHPDWRPTDALPVPAWSPERRHSSSVRWAYVQVFPALRRMIKDGLLTTDEIIEQIGDGEKLWVSVGSLLKSETRGNVRTAAEVISRSA